MCCLRRFVTFEGETDRQTDRQTDRETHTERERLSFSCGPHAPVNMAESMEQMNVGEKSP